MVLFGHLLFLALLVLSLQHWQLRTIHVDTACQVFKWINNEGLQVEAHRYSAIFPQLLVKLFASMGASLQMLLMVASVAHVLVPWVIFTMIAHFMSRPWHAAGLALAAVLCTRLTFYGIVLEVNYLLCYPFLLAAALDAVGERRRGVVLAWAALALVLLVHPLGAPVALFVILLYLIGGGDGKQGLMLGAVAVCWPMVARWLLPPTGYEQGLYDGVLSGWASLSRGRQQPAMDFFFGHTWGYTTHYLMWWLLFTGLIALLVRRKALRALLVVVSGMVGFFFVTVLTYHHGETAIMMEKNFLPLAVLVALPMLLEVARMRLRGQWAAFGIFAIVLFVQFRGISFASRPTSDRSVLLQELVDSARASGPGVVLVDPAQLDASGLHVHWALEYETVLLSSINAPEACVVVRAMDGPRFLNHQLDVGELDPRWFKPAHGPDHLLYTH